MNVDWPTYLRYKWLRPKEGLSAGVFLSQETATFTLIRSSNHSPQYDINETTVPFAQWETKLISWVKQHNLDGAATRVCFSQNWYQLLQLDKPEVEESELISALTWQAKELLNVDIPIVLDYFDLPVPLAGANKVNLAALPEDEIKRVVHNCLAAKLRLISISIEELALTELLPESEAAIVSLVQEGNEEIILNIVKEGKLYFSRRLKGFENLGSFSKDELSMGIIDSLCVQIQRSLDFFESQLRQAPARDIRIRLNTKHAHYIVEQIAQLVDAKITPLSLAPTIDERDIDTQNLSSLSMAMPSTSARSL